MSADWQLDPQSATREYWQRQWAMWGCDCSCPCGQGSDKQRKELAKFSWGRRNESYPKRCPSDLAIWGPKTRRSVRDIGKATHTLHIDIAGPFTQSDGGYSYFLVGPLRLPGSSSHRRSHTDLSNFYWDLRWSSENGCLPGGFTNWLPIGEPSRIKRLHSDRAGEFTAPFSARFLGNYKSIHRSFTSGYNPQSNGTAEGE